MSRVVIKSGRNKRNNWRIPKLRPVCQDLWSDQDLNAQILHVSHMLCMYNLYASFDILGQIHHQLTNIQGRFKGHELASIINSIWPILLKMDG